LKTTPIQAYLDMPRYSNSGAYFFRSVLFKNRRRLLNMESATNSIYFLTALFLVLLSGFLHALWNLFTKSSVRKDVFLWLCQWAGVIVYLPLVIFYIPQSVADIKSYSLLFASMILHGIYVILLAKTYSLGDLSQVYPIMRGTSLLLVPLISVFFLGLHLGIVSWIGISFIVLGIFFISGARLPKFRLDREWKYSSQVQ